VLALHGSEPLSLGIVVDEEQVAEVAEQAVEAGVADDDGVGGLGGGERGEGEAGVLGAAVVAVGLDHARQRLDQGLRVHAAQHLQAPLLVVADAADGEGAVHAAAGVVAAQRRDQLGEYGLGHVVGQDARAASLFY